MCRNVSHMLVVWPWTSVKPCAFLFCSCCRMTLISQSVAFQICLPPLLLWYLLESTARASSPPSIWNQQKDQRELEAAQCGWKKLLLGESKAGERGTGPSKSPFLSFFALWRKRPTAVFVLALKCLCSTIRELLTADPVCIFVSDCLYGSSVWGSAFLLPSLQSEDSVLKFETDVSVHADGNGSYFCVMLEQSMVKWTIKWGLRGTPSCHVENSSRILEGAFWAFSTKILMEDWELNPPFSLIHSFHPVSANRTPRCPLELR